MMNEMETIDYAKNRSRVARTEELLDDRDRRVSEAKVEQKVEHIGQAAAVEQGLIPDKRVL